MPLLRNQTVKKYLIVLLGFCSLQAMADNQRGFYAGGGFTLIKDAKNSVPETDEASAGEVFGGYKYNGLLAAELRVGFGTSTGDYKAYDDGVFQGTKIERDVGEYVSIYYKPEVINKEAKLYGLLGYTTMDITYDTYSFPGGVETLAASVEKKASGLSYGVGIGYVMNQHINVNLEWKNISEEIDNAINATSLTIDYRF
jgi:hypothetical protein